MHLTKVQLHLLGVLLAVMVTTVVSQTNSTNRFPTHPMFEFPKLNRSTMLRAKAMLRWLINNRTENGTRTFNAGIIRLIFHDCVGGCDGCINLNNPSHAGLGFYKLPLDMMYKDFIFPWMSRADWYALAGVTAVEFAAELTPCEGPRCRQSVPDMNFLYGRRDCANEANVFRFIPGPALDPRLTIRNTFRLNLAEITALMGAHSLGKNHERDTRWVDDGTKFNNQYYKDMLSMAREWERGNGTTSAQWTSKSTGNVMLSSDMFMAFDVSNPNLCTENPVESCNRTNTFGLVQLFAEDNEFWMREFSVAFNVMLMNGNFGRLKQPVIDTLDTVWTGEELFPEKNPESDYVFDPEDFGLPPFPTAAPNNATTAANNSSNATPAESTTATTPRATESVTTESGTTATPNVETTETDGEPTETEVETAETGGGSTETDGEAGSTPETAGDVTNTQPETPNANREVSTNDVESQTADRSEVREPEEPTEQTNSESRNDQVPNEQANDAESTNTNTEQEDATNAEDSSIEEVREDGLEESGSVGVVVAPSNKRRDRNPGFRRRLLDLRRRLAKQRNAQNN